MGYDECESHWSGAGLYPDYRFRSIDYFNPRNSKSPERLTDQPRCCLRAVDVVLEPDEDRPSGELAESLVLLCRGVGVKFLLGNFEGLPKLGHGYSQYSSLLNELLAQVRNETTVEMLQNHLRTGCRSLL